MNHVPVHLGCACETLWTRICTINLEGRLSSQLHSRRALHLLSNHSATVRTTPRSTSTTTFIPPHPNTTTALPLPTPFLITHPLPLPYLNTTASAFLPHAPLPTRRGATALAAWTPDRAPQTNPGRSGLSADASFDRAIIRADTDYMDNDQQVRSLFPPSFTPSFPPCPPTLIPSLPPSLPPYFPPSLPPRIHLRRPNGGKPTIPRKKNKKRRRPVSTFRTRRSGWRRRRRE